MQIREDFELLESLFVELDPLEDGFVGVLLEIYRHGDRYVLLETTPLRATNPQVLLKRQRTDLRSLRGLSTPPLCRHAIGAGSATRKRQSSTGELLRAPADYPGEG